MRWIKEFSWRLYQIVTAGCLVLTPVALSAQRWHPSAPGDTTPLYALTVIVSPGIRGAVGTQQVRTGDLANDDMRTLTILLPRGSTVQYAVEADISYENPAVMFDDDSVAPKGTITLTSDHSLIVTAERTIAMGSANRKLYELLRQQLTARDLLSAYVDVECETERLLKTFADSAEKLIDAANQKALDPTRDATALHRIDAALGGHMFEGCARDRRTYQRAMTKPAPTR